MTLMVILMLLIKTIVDWGRAKLSLDISKSFNLELSLKYYKNVKMVSLFHDFRMLLEFKKHW